MLKKYILPISIIISLLFLCYLPYLLYDFAFHNDFEIWSYDKKQCCSWFSETWHLIRVGRFLQAFLQNVYLSFFTDLHSLIYGRALAILFSAIAAILLFFQAKKNGMGSFTAAAFSLGVFLLPPAQINLGWLTNFIPGPFAVLIVLIAASIFPDSISLKSKDPKMWIRLLITFIFLVATLFIYPPTAGFFLLPTLIAVTYSGVKEIKKSLQALNSLIFYTLTCAIYFLFHRLIFMPIYNIKFPKTSFYRFDISGSPFENLYKFFTEIIPVMLNLWNPAPSLIIAGIVLLIGSITFLRHSQATHASLDAGSGRRESPRGDPLRSRCSLGVTIWLSLFLAINIPGLLSSGGPPTFYRAWHPGMAAILLLVFRSLDTLPWFFIKRATISLLILIGAFSAFNNSKHIATTLSKQFNYSIEQVKEQYEPEREHYVIVELRPKSYLFGRERWGEFGFIHVLSEGHVSYIIKNILKKELPTPRPIISLVADKRENLFLLESDLFEKHSPNLRWGSPLGESDPNFLFLDFFEATYFEKRQELPITIEISTDIPTEIFCYTLYSGIGETPDFLPKSWKFYGSMNRREWTLLDFQNEQIDWKSTESRLFKTKNKSKNLHFRFEINSTNQPNIVRIPELRFFTLESACEDTKNKLSKNYGTESFIQPTTVNGQHITVAGVVTESGLTDPQRRLQKALDNIYYTFWETWLLRPVSMDIHFNDEKIIRCYSIQGGEDKSNDLMPKEWRVFASNGFEKWELLDFRDKEINWSDNERRIYAIKNPNDFSYYKIEFRGVNYGKILRIYEIDLSEDSNCIKTMP